MFLKLTAIVLLTISFPLISALNVTLYYEALCPDSIKFVKEQLVPTYQQIPTFGIEFVPFGFAEVDNSSGTWNFTCQHGSGECYSNMAQSCVIDSNPAKAFDFVYCVMISDDPSDTITLQQCAKMVDINWSDIEVCLDTDLGAELLIKNGNLTEAVEPPIAFIPTITFNGVFNQTLQDESIDNFQDVVCALLETKPDICA